MDNGEGLGTAIAPARQQTRASACLIFKFAGRTLFNRKTVHVLGRYFIWANFPKFTVYYPCNFHRIDVYDFFDLTAVAYVSALIFRLAGSFKAPSLK